MKSQKTPSHNSGVLVLTSYPSYSRASKTASNFNAVGWHSKRLLASLSEIAPVTVLAEQLKKRQTIHETDSMTIERIWQKGNVLSTLSLFFYIITRPEKTILVQFEFNVFGGIVPNLAVLLLLLGVRLSGKRVSFEVHQVITDIKKLEKHVHITNPLLQKFFDVSLMLFYRLLGIIVNDIIVFESNLKNELSHFVPADKITVLALAVEENKTIARTKAQTILNQMYKNAPRYRAIKKDEFVVLLFGFINGYKGIDWIIEYLGKRRVSNVRLLVVGGQNPYLKNEAHYQRFYQSILASIQKYPNISHTDFIRDENIYLGFSAADLVVLPYEVFMSASGPFSHALGYKKPILISSVLGEYVKSPDFAQSLAAGDLASSDVMFSFSGNDLENHIATLRTNPRKLQKLITFSEVLAQKRSMKSIVKRLYAVLAPKAAATYQTQTVLAR